MILKQLTNYFIDEDFMVLSDHSAAFILPFVQKAT